LVLGFYIYSYEGLEYREQLKEETEVKWLECWTTKIDRGVGSSSNDDSCLTD
jgi:hypothetical protein